MAHQTSVRTLGECVATVLADLIEQSVSDPSAYRVYEALFKQYTARVFDKKQLAEAVKTIKAGQRPDALETSDQNRPQ